MVVYLSTAFLSEECSNLTELLSYSFAFEIIY